MAGDGGRGRKGGARERGLATGRVCKDMRANGDNSLCRRLFRQSEREGGSYGGGAIYLQHVESVGLNILLHIKWNAVAVPTSLFLHRHHDSDLHVFSIKRHIGLYVVATL